MAAPTFFSGRRGGGFCCERIWNNYFEIQWTGMQVIFIILLCTRGYNFLRDPTRQYKVWRKILLQTDPFERLTACVLGNLIWWWKQNKTQLFNLGFCSPKKLCWFLLKSQQTIFKLFVFDDLQLQIIESISPKASVENSSTQWAIFDCY